MLEPGVTETNWSLLTTAPDGILAVAVRATNEPHVVLIELGTFERADAGPQHWFVHRAQLDALIGVLEGWRKLYGSGPGRQNPPGEGGGP